uniref:Uncharacterized protein n=1 Tax=Strix occidentalis caurina TaxID=311401 RepID=A0A8D0FVG4_STROC
TQKRRRSQLSRGQLYGLEKFWAYLKYSQHKTPAIDPKLQEYLSKFKRLEDFRVDVSEDSGHRRHQSNSSKTLLAAKPTAACQSQAQGNITSGNTVQASIGRNSAATKSIESDVPEK